MREILFRGKTYSDKWVYGYLLKGSIDNDFYILENVGGTPFWIDPETIGQYTGLTDKNGKKIFEGDIIKSKSGNTYLIHFNDGSFAFADKDRIVVNYSLDDSEFGIAYKGICDGHEVIGNVFDNPELLEKDNA